MKHTRPDSCLSRELLCLVHDCRPTVDEFIARFGGQMWHLLRKHGALVVEDDRIRLNRDHLSPDGRRFMWKNSIFHLDTNEIHILCPESDGSRRGPTDAQA